MHILHENFNQTDPFVLFRQWLDKARETEINDPEAMALATVEHDGMPAVRMVLLKEVDDRGFCFYTNMESNKGRALQEHPVASICFHWKTQSRQVRVQGAVEVLPDAWADRYFASRHPQSRLGAWASQQSRPLKNREELLERLAKATARFSDGDIPRPPYWGGYRIIPRNIEFWQADEFRLHDRIVFTRTAGGWSAGRLNP